MVAKKYSNKFPCLDRDEAKPLSVTFWVLECIV